MRDWFSLITKRRENRELAFENEEGRVWEVIKPMFSTASSLNNTHIHNTCMFKKNSKKRSKELMLTTQYKCKATYLPFKASDFIELIKVLQTITDMKM